MCIKALFTKAVFVFLLFLFFSSSTIAKVKYETVLGDDDIESLLEVVASDTKNNYMAIKYWEGRTSIINKRYYYGEKASKEFEKVKTSQQFSPKKLAIISECIVDFKVDNENNSLCINFQRPEPFTYEDLDSGRKYNSEGKPYKRKHIVNKEITYELIPYVLNKDGSVFQNRAIKRKSFARNGLYDIGIGSDPRSIFKYNGDIWQWAEALKNVLISDIYEPSEFSIVIRQSSKGPYMYRVQYPILGDKKEVLASHEFVFAEEYAFNPILSKKYDVNDNLIRAIEISYEIIQDIALPKSVQMFDYDTEGRLQEESVYKINNISLNEPIIKPVFSFDTIGLKDGDLLIDKIEKKTYQWSKAKGLIEKDEKSKISNRTKKNFSSTGSAEFVKIELVDESDSSTIAMPFGEQFEVVALCEIVEPGSYYIFIRPYTNGKKSKDYKAHTALSLKGEAGFSDMLVGSFSFDQAATVDEIRVTVKNRENNQYVEKYSFPVQVEWVGD